VGRFLSRDSVQPNAQGTQGYDPYAYVANNPVSRTDPSGHSVGACDICTPVAFAAVEAFATYFAYLRAILPRALEGGPGETEAWKVLAFGAVGLLLACLASPLCHEGRSAPGGRGQDWVEDAVGRAAVVAESAAQGLEELWEAIREHLKKTQTDTDPNEEPRPPPPPPPPPDDPKPNCDDLNSGEVPPLPDGVAVGDEMVDYGLAHILAEHGYGSTGVNGDHGWKSKFAASYSNRAGLEDLRDRAVDIAMSMGLTWELSAATSGAVDEDGSLIMNCKIDVPFPTAIGYRGRSDYKKPACSLFMVARSEPPHELVTMFPRMGCGDGTPVP
jgi:hypothetical protein